MWHDHVSPVAQMPLINADRMMMSILPEVAPGTHLPAWAATLRDGDARWMEVAQKGVEGFVSQAMTRKVPFAMETVFSHWKEHPDGRVESKVERIEQLQAGGYFVLLLFVGLADAQLSIARVLTRVGKGGHAVEPAKLESRFPRTQKAIRHAACIADAAILVDNSRGPDRAFAVCRIQRKSRRLFDLRDRETPPPVIRAWLEIVSPRSAT